MRQYEFVAREIDEVGRRWMEGTMDHVGEAWFEGLCAYRQEIVSRMPLPKRESFSLVEEWRCRIIGGAFINWHKDIGPPILAGEAGAIQCLGC